MKRYELTHEAPGVLSNIEHLYRGARIATPKGELLSTIFDVAPGRRRYTALTMFTGNDTPIAICDTMSTADTQTTVLESPVIKRRPDFTVPALELRMLADIDGMFVADGHRNQTIGALMLKTSMELARRFGSRWFVVRNGGTATMWYTSLGGKESMSGVTFDLQKLHR